jgi:hypothetical protein
MSSHHAFVRLSMPLLTELENHLLASLAINMALLTRLGGFDPRPNFFRLASC